MSGSDQDAMYQRVLEKAELIHGEHFEDHGGCFTVEGTDGAGDIEYVAGINEPGGITLLIPKPFLEEGSTAPYPANPGTTLWIVGDDRLNVREDEDHIMLRFHTFDEEMESILVYAMSYVTQRFGLPPAQGPEEAT